MKKEQQTMVVSPMAGEITSEKTAQVRKSVDSPADM